MGKIITPHITWVGKVDWELKMFHGNELSTQRGSSYNSYLVRGTEKTVLIDTVWHPYDDEFISHLRECIDLSEIDAVIMNHNEVDHSGALPELMRAIPNTPVYCTKKGETIIRGHYHPTDWDLRTVKTGDTLALGGITLTFIEATMLHWPDTMMTYADVDGGVLFSNDVFGQHFATETLYDDTENLDELFYEAKKYYANIVAPYSALANKKVKEVLAMNLPLALVCPSHGVIWRKNINAIVEKYLAWSANYQENQLTIVYDTMWNSTRTMAQEIACGVQEVDPSVCIKLLNAAKDDKNDVLTELFSSKAFLIGSPTVNNGYTYAIAGLLEMFKGLRLPKKKAAAFGSYGWGGEAVKLLTAHLNECGCEILNDGLRCQWVPDGDAIEQCREYGRKIAKEL